MRSWDNIKLPRQGELFSRSFSLGIPAYTLYGMPGSSLGFSLRILGYRPSAFLGSFCSIPAIVRGVSFEHILLLSILVLLKEFYGVQVCH